MLPLPVFRVTCVVAQCCSPAVCVSILNRGPPNPTVSSCFMRTSYRQINMPGPWDSADKAR